MGSHRFHIHKLGFSGKSRVGASQGQRSGVVLCSWVSVSEASWQGTKPGGRAVLLSSLTLLLSTQAPLPNKISCFVS